VPLSFNRPCRQYWKRDSAPAIGQLIAYQQVWSDIMRTAILLAMTLAMTFSAFVDDKAKDKPDNKPKDKPTIKVQADGFPAGHDTPEGAACDLARSFIKRDVKLFEATCDKRFTKGEGGEKYKAFLKKTAESITEESQRQQPSPDGPKTIAKVFASRHLSDPHGHQLAFVEYDFHEIKFVDVGLIQHNGKRYLNRTFVLKDDKGKWFVHPLPSSCPTISAGLNKESDSKIDFAEVYHVEKAKEEIAKEKK
jgi:hypothetical protein